MLRRPAIGFETVWICPDDRKTNGAKRAKWDGKPARKPKKGELFLSGSVVMAYRGPNDLNNEYFIAEEVKE